LGSGLRLSAGPLADRSLTSRYQSPYQRVGPKHLSIPDSDRRIPATRVGRFAAVRLIKVGVSNYRRFRTHQEMDVDGKLIAVVGPNEAGKTSFLKALAGHLNGPSSFKRREFTRNEEQPVPAVWARFVVEDDDRAFVVARVPEAHDLRQIVVTKQAGDDSLSWIFEPPVTRDREPRQKLVAAIDKHWQASGSLPTMTRVTPFRAPLSKLAKRWTLTMRTSKVMRTQASIHFGC
jgi:hypothetical protein